MPERATNLFVAIGPRALALGDAKVCPEAEATNQNARSTGVSVPAVLLRTIPKVADPSDDAIKELTRATGANPENGVTTSTGIALHVPAGNVSVYRPCADLLELKPVPITGPPVELTRPLIVFAPGPGGPVGP